MTVKSVCECGSDRFLINNEWVCLDCHLEKLRARAAYHHERARFFSILTWVAAFLSGFILGGIV